MTIRDRRLSTAEVQDLTRPLENDLVAFYRLVSDAAESLLDRAVSEGWTPEQLIDELDRMIGGDNRAAETQAVPALEDLRVNKGANMSDQKRDESGKFSSGGSSESFQIDPKKIRETPIPKDLKAKWMKNGGVNNPEYKKWIKANWAAKSMNGGVPPAAQRFIDAARALGVNPVEFYAGILTESKEHGVSFSEGAKIALDHLRKEDPEYYTKLQAAGL
jgi:hypothetical protein